MKTYRHLYPQIASFQNLLDAFYKARKGKRDKSGVAAFEYNLEQEPLLYEQQYSHAKKPSGHLESEACATIEESNFNQANGIGSHQAEQKAKGRPIPPLDAQIALSPDSKNLLS